MLTGALFGALGALIGIIIVITAKKQKFNSLMKSVTDPGVEYSGFFYYASPTRYQKAMKVYDSTGVLYLIGNTVYYKTGATSTPISFNLKECKLQQEADWRRLKWFSITTPNGEKYYFDSFKIGAFTNDSSETLTAFNRFKSKQGEIVIPPPLYQK